MICHNILQFEGMHIRKLGCNRVKTSQATMVITYNMFDHVLQDGDAEHNVNGCGAVVIVYYLCQWSCIIHNCAVEKC